MFFYYSVFLLFLFISNRFFDSSPVVNIKLANADVDQDPDFLPQVNNLINENGAESSELIDDQIKQKTLK